MKGSIFTEKNIQRGSISPKEKPFIFNLSSLLAMLSLINHKKNYCADSQHIYEITPSAS